MHVRAIVLPLLAGLILPAGGSVAALRPVRAAAPAMPTVKASGSLAGTGASVRSAAGITAFDEGYLRLAEPLPDTLRVMAIRVNFLPDTLATTWGDGSFMYQLPDSIRAQDWIVDAPPHDRQYFQDHLLAARNYFQRFSHDGITLAGVLNPEEGGDVFPLADQASYQMPYPVWHINYGNDDLQRLNERLVGLFIDAWTAADADPDVDVSNYDVFIVFHSGAGNEFDTGFDLTPFDIPSVYITSADLETYGALPDGVPTGEGRVPDGIILPSTQRQPGIDVGLHGTVCAQIGFSLGMPHLYNTETGEAGVGMFDLMDRGFGAYFGIIPTPPSAWTRAFMRWEDPVTLDASAGHDSLALGALHLWHSPAVPPQDPNLHRSIRLPINDSEYFLLEARRRDPDDDSLTFAFDRAGRRMMFHDNYSVEAEPGFRVAVTIDDYGFDLPASGVLVWHVDDKVIRAKYDRDALQTDMDRRAVRLEEADGAWDIGEEYPFLTAGDGTEYGWYYDGFFRDNLVWRDANFPLFNVEFSTNTSPSSIAQNGGFSHIAISRFSDIGDTMTFAVGNSWRLPGFPMTLPDGSGRPVDITLADLDGFSGDGQTDEILISTDRGELYAFDGTGEPLGPQPVYTTSNGEQFVYAAADVDSSADTDGGMGAEVFLAFTETVVRLDWQSESGSWRRTERYVDAFAAASLTIIPAGAEGGVYKVGVLFSGEDTSPPTLLLADGELSPPLLPRPVLSGEAGFMNGSEGWLLAARIEGSDAPAFVAVFDNHTLTEAISEPPASGVFGAFPFEMLGGSPEPVPDMEITGPVVDVLALQLDDDEFDEIVARTENDWLIVWGQFWHPIGHGDLATPQIVYTTRYIDPGIELGELRAMDPDSDGLAEIAFISPGTRNLFALEAGGAIGEGTPIELTPRLGAPVAGGGLLFDADGDGTLEWVTSSFGGTADSAAATVVSYDLETGREVPGFPLDFSHNAGGPPPLLAVGRLDEDEEYDLAILTPASAPEDEAVLNVYRVPSRGGDPGAAPWSQAGGDAARGRRIELETQGGGGGGGSTRSGAEPYIWPNPVLDEDIAHVRFMPDFSGTDAGVRIYDLVGREMISVRQSFYGGTDADFAIDVSSLPSGVYVARLETDQGVKTIRFAVVN